MVRLIRPEKLFHVGKFFFSFFVSDHLNPSKNRKIGQKLDFHSQYKG